MQPHRGASTSDNSESFVHIVRAKRATLAVCEPLHAAPRHPAAMESVSI